MRSSQFEDHATAMLARERAHTTSLDRLFRDMKRQWGPVVRDPEELRERLGRHPDRFLILDPPGPPADSAVLPDTARDARDAALESAGVATKPHVTLVGPVDSNAPLAEPNPMEPLVKRLDSSIRALSAVTTEDPTLADALAEALRETRELQRAFSFDPAS